MSVNLATRQLACMFLENTGSISCQKQRVGISNYDRASLVFKEKSNGAKAALITHFVTPWIK